MKPELRRFGREQSPVVVIDQFTGAAEKAVALARSLAPFPAEEGSLYPGLRRVIDEADDAAFAYARACCQDAAPFIAGAFDIGSFTLVTASFSMVTASPDRLSERQRIPHYDSTDPDYIALLHYLTIPAPSGTAFFRQRSTGIERVSDANVDLHVATVMRELRDLPGDSGYIHGSNEQFEEIGAVEAVPDRMVIYQGCLLHSGIIPPAMPLSDDVGVGRLTANFFIRGQRG